MIVPVDSRSHVLKLTRSASITGEFLQQKWMNVMHHPIAALGSWCSD